MVGSFFKNVFIIVIVDLNFFCFSVVKYIYLLVNFNDYEFMGLRVWVVGKIKY